MDLQQLIDGVGPRLRRLRADRGETLADVATATGISVSTLSRLESGGRRSTLELLLPLAEHHEVTLDEIVRPARRAARRTTVRQGATYVPLSAAPGGLRAYKVILDPGAGEDGDEQGTHEGYEWVYVMSGRLRLRLGAEDFQITEGEAAEFDTRSPHRLSNPAARPAELLAIFGVQGERVHVRARPGKRAALRSR